MHTERSHEGPDPARRARLSVPRAYPGTSADRIRALQRAAGNSRVALLLRDGPTALSGSPRERRSALGAARADAVGQAARTAWAFAPTVQRAPPTTGTGTPVVAAPAASPVFVYLTVRDPSIGLGGKVVPDLAAVKATMMARHQAERWTLVLAIHGSLDRIAAQAPPDWQKNAVFYGAAEIKKLFGGDQAFVTWRDAFGPERVVLLGCQVGATFEQVVADNLTRGGSGLRAQGLGEGCKPITRTQVVSWGPAGREKPIRTRADFIALAPDDRTNFLAFVRDLNRKWGYLGMPPVDERDALRFYLEEEPLGSWAIVEVHKKLDPNKDDLTPLGVPYFNRMGNSTFLQNCSMGVGRLGGGGP